MNNVFKEMMTFVDKGIDCVLVTVIEKHGEGPIEVGKKMVVSEHNDAHGTVGGGHLNTTPENTVKQFLKIARASNKSIYYKMENGLKMPQLYRWFVVEQLHYFTNL